MKIIHVNSHHLLVFHEETKRKQEEQTHDIEIYIQLGKVMERYTYNSETITTLDPASHYHFATLAIQQKGNYHA